MPDPLVTLRAELTMLTMRGRNIRHLAEFGCPRRKARALTAFKNGDGLLIEIARYTDDAPAEEQLLEGLAETFAYFEAEVPSLTGATAYQVTLETLRKDGTYNWTCTCEDAKNPARRGACKHVRLFGLLLLRDMRGEFRSKRDAITALVSLSDPAP